MSERRALRRGGLDVLSNIAPSGVAAVLAWGLAPVVTRALVVHADPLGVLGWRLLIVAVVLAPLGGGLLARVDGRERLRLFGAGVLQTAGYYLPVTVGLERIPASVSALLLASEPVWILLAGRVLHREMPSARRWVGSAIALLGVALLLSPSPGASEPDVLGSALVVVAAAGFACGTVVIRPLSARHGATRATAAAFVLGSLPFIPFAGRVGVHGLARIGPHGMAELAFLAIVSTAGGTVLWNRAVCRQGSARMSALLYLVPVVGVLAGVLALGERTSPIEVLGALCVLGGAMTASHRAPTAAGA